MKRLHLGALIGVACLAACGNDIPTQPSAFAPAAPATETVLYGRLIASDTRDVQLKLVAEDGSTIGLGGDQTAWLASVIDADVEVRGVMASYNEMIVERFLVRAVQGRQASDGVLEEDGDAGYALRLTESGDRVELADAPEELKALVGQRIWITGSDEGSPPTFGAIVDASRLIEQRRARGANARHLGL
jgi:hypothetical protein